MKRPLLAAVAAALVFAAPAAAASYDDADYWSFADRMEQRSTTAGTSRPATTSSAAAASSRWPTRCCCSPTASPRCRATSARPATTTAPGCSPTGSSAARPYVTSPGAGQSHAPGWVNAMNGRGAQHLVFDAEVVDGLVYAYRAREALQLPDIDRRRRSATRSTAPPAASSGATRRSGLNQVNWYALMYAADATVTGDNTLAQARHVPAAPALLRRRRGERVADRQLRPRHALPLPPAHVASTTARTSTPPSTRTSS